MCIFEVRPVRGTRANLPKGGDSNPLHILEGLSGPPEPTRPGARNLRGRKKRRTIEMHHKIIESKIGP